MKTRSIFLLLLLSVIIPSVSFSQGYLLRRAINRKLEHKVDSAVDKSDRDEAAKARANEKNSDSTTVATNQVQKKPVAVFSAEKLTSNMMMNTISLAGCTCNWKTTRKKKSERQIFIPILIQIHGMPELRLA